MLISEGTGRVRALLGETAAATLAKADGIVIIPVFISAEYDEDALGFMRRLSSDDRVFDVTNFESLKIVARRLAQQAYEEREALLRLDVSNQSLLRSCF